MKIRFVALRYPTHDVLRARMHTNVHLRMRSSTWRPQRGEAIIVLRIALCNDPRGMLPLGDLEEPVSTGVYGQSCRSLVGLM